MNSLCWHARAAFANSVSGPSVSAEPAFERSNGKMRFLGANDALGFAFPTFAAMVVVAKRTHSQQAIFCFNNVLQVVNWAFGNRLLVLGLIVVCFFVLFYKYIFWISLCSS
jgi:hypothetical protein